MRYTSDMSGQGGGLAQYIDLDEWAAERPPIDDEKHHLFQFSYAKKLLDKLSKKESQETIKKVRSLISEARDLMAKGRRKDAIEKATKAVELAQKAIEDQKNGGSAAPSSPKGSGEGGALTRVQKAWERSLEMEGAKEASGTDLAITGGTGLAGFWLLSKLL